MNVKISKLNHTMISQGNAHEQVYFGKGLVNGSNVIASNSCSRESQRSLTSITTDELGKEVEEFDYLAKFHTKYNKSEAGNLQKAASKPSNIEDILRLMRNSTLADAMVSL